MKTPEQLAVEWHKAMIANGRDPDGTDGPQPVSSRGLSSVSLAWPQQQSYEHLEERRCGSLLFRTSRFQSDLTPRDFGQASA
jgi:hypothetical protein